MTSPARWASTASCGRTRSSTSASRSGWSRSRARAARWKSCSRLRIPPATSPRSRAREGWRCTRRAMRPSPATRARSSGCSACRGRSGRIASSCITRSSFPPTAMTGPALEGLVRLLDASGHALHTAEFMRAAQRYRLMGLVDRWVVQQTFTAIASGAMPVPARRSVAINVSGQTLDDSQFLEFVVECFDSSGVAPAQVCFEISENAVVANLDHARRFVGVLHGMGCQFTLDDFGTGMGSFLNLKNLPLDYLTLVVGLVGEYRVSYGW